MKFLVLMCAVFQMFLFTVSSTNSTSEWYTFINSTNLAKPGCDSRCGDLIVPYPFGVGNNSECYINERFRIYCNTSLNPPKATIYEGGYNSIKLISDSTIRLSNQLASWCYSPNGTAAYFPIRMRRSNVSPYSLSKVNKLTVIGCDSSAFLRKYIMVGSSVYDIVTSTGCSVYCSYPEEVVAGECTGNGCCQSSIPNGMTFYGIALRNSTVIRNRTWALPCTYAFVGEENVFKFKGVNDLNDTNFKKEIEDTVPIVLEWAIGNQSCSEAKATDGFACQSNSICVNSTSKRGGYRCECKEGYEGNPYLSPGCQDINECDRMEDFPCYGTCINTPGNYTCKCKKGYSGDGKIQNDCRRNPFNVLGLSIGMGIGFLALLTGLLVLYFMAKKIKIAKLREKFYEQNGGALLEEKLKTTGGGVGFMKVFRFEELKEATDNYVEDRILGRGGNGIVYKGTLPDKCVVAIKKSQRLDQEQREQFINEMVILTQIKHQNVVQLLGCCLETDVPLLVYEFVPNNTLHHHIHNRKSGMGRLSWVNRLRIAHESAGALAYLHTNVRMTIIHRDVKSTNILLDENYTAKIADFGASRLVPLGHDQVTTLVQGTFGYLDPEYFHTGQLTDKSDVYSFGVVLAELITGQRPLNMERCLEDRNLATYFVKAKKEDRLHELLDRQMIEEATDEQLKAACDLVYRCLNLVGGNRPSMKEVSMELESLRKQDKHPWIHQESYNETRNLMGECEETDLITVPLVEYGSSSIGTEGIMLQVQNPR